MNNQREADKNYIKLLILDCETFHLNEKESIVYISRKLKRKISRTSYYKYKKEITGSDKNSIFCLFSNPKWERSLSWLDRIAIRNNILNSVTDTRIRSHNAWNDPEFVSKYGDRFFVGGYALVEQTKKLSTRINSQQDLALKNYESIPSNATIRKEFVKCGNAHCCSCKHGPYYYAYWKKGRILKKKYIGRYDPRSQIKSS